MPFYLWYMVTLPINTVCASVTGYLFLALSIWYSLPSKGIKSTPGDKTERKTLKIKKMESIKNILKRIECNTLLATKTVLTVDDVATLTGLSKSHIYKLTYSHQIPHYKPSGKQVYFDRSEIEEWLKRNRVDSVEEIEQAAINHVVMNKKGRGRV